MHNFQTLLLLIATLNTQLWFTAAKVMQVDLVFPRNNTVYQPVYPFPIAFAIHNFAQLWNHHPNLDWSLEHVELGPVARGVIGWDYKRDPKQHGWVPPPDKYLAINTTTIFSSPDLYTRYNNSAWRIIYEFSVVDPTCFDKGNWSSHYFSGTINFSTSNTTGIKVLPDIAASSCASPLGAVDFNGTYQSAQGFCPPLSLKPEPVLCAYQADAQTAEQVSNAMVVGSGCIKWPNGTYIGVECEKPKSDSSVLRTSFLAVIFPVFTMVLWSWN
jgi:hypothetical protein